MSEWCHHNETHSWYLGLQSPQNVYLGFFIFWKLTEWCRFVTYLWDKPREHLKLSVTEISEILLQRTFATNRYAISQKKTGYMLSSMLKKYWHADTSSLQALVWVGELRHYLWSCVCCQPTYSAAFSGLPVVLKSAIVLKFYSFGHNVLIWTLIFKFVATRWHPLRLKCTKFDFGWGSTSDTAGGAYSAPPGRP